MSALTTTFFRGLGAVLPVALTIWIVIWLARSTEALLKPVFLFLLPEAYYLPGLGFALGVVIVYGVGLLLPTLVIGRLWVWVQALFERVPLVKSIYSALTDFFDFFTRQPSDTSAVVSADLFGNGTRVIGFITDRQPKRLAGSSDSGLVAVYFPMSYQIGGYTLLVPEDKLTHLDIGVEDAMRLVLTAGIQKQRPEES